MSTQNARATEGTLKANVAIQGVNHEFNAQTVSITGPDSQWIVRTGHRMGDLLLSLDLFIDKAKLPSDGTLTRFDLNPANGRNAYDGKAYDRKTYGKCGYFKDGGSSYDMLSTSGLLEISFNGSTEKMTGSFNFEASSGGLTASVTDATFSLTGLDQSIQA